MGKFRYLDVPRQWTETFTKYPHGLTIFEALVDWTSQVDKMVDNINDWNDYLDGFVDNFEFELQEEVKTTIEKWQNEGLLDDIIGSVLETELDILKSDVVTIDIEQWQLSKTDVNGVNADIISQKISELPQNKLYEVIVNDYYEFISQITLENRLIKFTGSGGFKAKTEGMTILKATNCPGITINISIDGNGLAKVGVDLQECPFFYFGKQSEIKNVGNSNINNVSGLYLSYGNDYGVADKLKITNIVGQKVSTGINLTNNRDITKYSKGLRFRDIEITDVYPRDDGDGIKILQQGFNSDIRIENSRFIRCAKRGLKTQTNGVVSENNYYEDCSGHASIDFQLGGGKSINDKIVVNEGSPFYSTFGISGNDCSVKGLRAIVPEELYGIDITNLANEVIERLELEDIHINGTRYPMRIRDEVKINELVIRNCSFKNFTGSYVGNIIEDVEIKKIIIEGTEVHKDGSLYGFLNMNYDLIDTLESYRIVNNDIRSNVFGVHFPRKRGIIKNNIGHAFEEENEIRISTSTIIPSNRASNLYLYSKKGDIAINNAIVEQGETGSKFVVLKWVCIEDGDGQSNKGTWVPQILSTGN
jgi:hypothetical protein